MALILGWRNASDALAHYWQSRFSSEGSLWIVMMDGLLLIPLVFAVLFYPGPTLAAIGLILVATLVLVEAVHFARTRRLGWRHH
jgi:hypothetical protein